MRIYIPSKEKRILTNREYGDQKKYGITYKIETFKKSN